MSQRVDSLHMHMLSPCQDKTQAHLRYGLYSKCTTILEALRAGATPRDLDHDFARGYLSLTDVKEICFTCGLLRPFYCDRVFLQEEDLFPPSKDLVFFDALTFCAVFRNDFFWQILRHVALWKGSAWCSARRRTNMDQQKLIYVHRFQVQMHVHKFLLIRRRS